MRELVHDNAYQRRLRRDFCRRRVAPVTETAVWTRVLGPAPQAITVSADVTLDARLREERELFARLDLPDLERLAAKSEALVAEARELVAAQRVKNSRATVPGAPVNPDEHSAPPGDQGPGTDSDEG